MSLKHLTPRRSAEVRGDAAAGADRLGRDVGQRGQLRAGRGRADRGIVLQDGRPVGKRARRGQSSDAGRTLKKSTTIVAAATTTANRREKKSYERTGSCSTSWANSHLRSLLSRPQGRRMRTKKLSSKCLGVRDAMDTVPRKKEKPTFSRQFSIDTKNIVHWQMLVFRVKSTLSVLSP